MGLGLCCAQARAQENRAQAPPAKPSAALQRALDSVSPGSIAADLRFLASDALRGRNTPSPELKLAALYLQNRVQRLGLAPGAEGGWLYDYPLFRPHFDVEQSFLKASGPAGDVDFAFGRDYFLQRATHLFDVDLKAPLVSVGNGSKKDFEALASEGGVLQGGVLQGNWALLAHGGRPLGPVLRRAEAAGARGLVATPRADYSRTPYAEKYAKQTAFLLVGRATPNAFEPKVLLPQVMLTEGSAERLLRAAGRAVDGGFPAAGEVLDLSLHEVRRRLTPMEPVHNVCAFWPGSHETLAREVMIVSAHYDHVGERGGEIFNGADDNASGTSGLLALAEALVAGGPLQRSVLLLWVSGEEKNLWGSAAWTRDPWLPEGCRAVLDINIDMIGRNAPEELYITPSREHSNFNEVARLAYELSHLEGFPELQSQDEYWRRSDHMNFHDELGIPVVFLSSGDHPDYHEPSDTADLIEYEKLSRTVRLVLRMLDSLQAAPLSP